MGRLLSQSHRLEWEPQRRAEAAVRSPCPSLKPGSPLSSRILAFLLGLVIPSTEAGR